MNLLTFDNRGVGSAHETNGLLDADVASMTWLMQCQRNHSLGSIHFLGKPSLMGSCPERRAKILRSNWEDRTDS